MKPIIAITLGDPMGIGPEITVSALSDKRVSAACVPLIIGDISAAEKCGFDKEKILNIDTGSLQPLPKKHAPSAAGGLSSFKAVRVAAALALKGKVKAVCTAPVSKESWALAGIKYMGHTEFFKETSSEDGNALMMFTAGKYRCALASEHVALKDLCKTLTKEKLQSTILQFRSALMHMGIKNPKIIVSALNPHSGDNGKIGCEERDLIIPVIKSFNKKNYRMEGPLPVDVMWPIYDDLKADGAVFMYHDAALTGLKLIAREPIIHRTFGLKFTRTSPTHGTAFDIAGKNKADAAGMVSAILEAAK
ncbi:4-hydroxythreonine-4-phosphate dehydrogenase [Parelusimicrobium proximum]|uniref:PdxA family dehydrogenase n=1 Tax=Parelusimicrobium proximum TaxID=3228953 RepID=UPI003D181ADA